MTPLEFLSLQDALTHAVGAFGAFAGTTIAGQGIQVAASCAGKSIVKQFGGARKGKLPENHHILIALRTAMLSSTGLMLKAAKAEAAMEPPGRQEQAAQNAAFDAVEKWISKESTQVSKRVRGADYTNLAHDHLPLLLTGDTGAKEIAVGKEALRQQIVAAWQKEIEDSIECSFPPALADALADGWMAGGKRLEWFSTACFWFGELLKDPKDPNMVAAQKAYTDRLLADTAAGVGLSLDKLDKMLGWFETQTGNADYLREAFAGMHLRFDEMGKQLATHNATLAGVSETGQDTNRLLREFLVGVMPTVPVAHPGMLTGPGDARLQPIQSDIWGRDIDIEDILAQLRKERPVLISAAAGMGKTEVCKAVLKGWLGALPDGHSAWYISFPDRSGAGEAIGVIGTAIGVSNAATFADLRPALQPGLYYLDNLESVAATPDGATLLRELKACAGVLLLATSRTPIPAIAKARELGALPADAALTLFCDAWTGDGDGPEDTPALRRFLDAQLGQHALPIVLVAALGQAYPLPRIMALWRQSGTAVAAHAGADAHRLASLNTSLHLTSEVLLAQPGALTLWGLAALFPEGMPVRVADSLIEAAGIEETARPLLATHHVWRLRGERYAVLPALARFALDMAVAEKDGFSWVEIRRIYAAFLTPLARQANATASTDDNLQVKHFVRSIFSSVLQFVQVEERCAAPDLDFIAALAVSLNNLYLSNVAISRELLPALRLLLGSYADLTVPAIVEIRSGDLERHLGHVEEARRCYTQAKGLYEKEQADLGLANVLQSLGDLEHQLGHVEEARRCYTQAKGLYEKEQNDLGLANVLQSLGHLERQLGDVEEARRCYTQAKGLYEKEQADLGLANVLRSLGDLERLLGHVEEARRLYTQAKGLYEKEQNDLGLANVLQSLGDLEHQLGHVEEARRLYTQAKGLYEKEQADLGLANVLRSLGDLERLLGHVEEARRLYTQAKGLYEKEQDDLGLANVLRSLGDLERRLGHVEEARRLYTQAKGLYEKEQAGLGLANVLQSLGDLEYGSEMFDAALACYDAARALYLGEQEPVGLAYTGAERVRCFHKLGRQEEIIEAAEEAIGAAIASNNPHVKGYVGHVLREVGLLPPPGDA